MKTTIDYIDAAIAKGKFKNDSHFAKAMKWSSGQMTHYRKGTRVIQTRHCLTLASYLQLPLQESVRLIVLAETERSGQLPLDTRDFFQQVMQLIGFTVSVAWISGAADPTLHGHASLALALTALPCREGIAIGNRSFVKLRNSIQIMQLSFGRFQLVVVISFKRPFSDHLNVITTCPTG